MSERFLDLAALLRPKPPPLEVEEEELPPALPAEDEAAVDIAREIARFRARLDETFERERVSLLEDLATGVLARELRLAAVDVDAIARRLMREHGASLPIALRVAATDRARCESFDLPVESDARLRSGDVVLVVRDGALESTLGVRLAAVLRAVGAR